LRLWYHADSDVLYLAATHDDPYAEDVTDDPKMRAAAKARGLKFTMDREVTSEPHTMADAIVASYRKWERKPADLYPTPVNAVEAIMDLLKALDVHRVWEPACGDGRIARVLEWHGMDVTGTDLRENTGYGNGGINFLSNDPIRKLGLDVGQFDAIITNPPFSHAREFIERSLDLAPVVVMLVKQNYYNTENRYDFFNEKRPNIFLPLTWRLAFLPERGKSPLMDCAWAVWVRDNTDECRMQPVRKKVYPGYHGPGILSATAGLTEACDELAKVLPILAESLRQWQDK
jgi:hypothetical protein